MSDKKNPLISFFNIIRAHPLFPKVKDIAIFTGWIAGLILIASLCWFLTQSVRSRFLLNSVNRVLEQADHSHRLNSPVSAAALKPGLGSWYTMRPAGERFSPSGDSADGTRAYIFTLIAEGTFFPCAAVVNSGGKVEEFIPLTKGGKRMIKRLSPGILGIYSRRIEGIGS